MAKIYLRKMAGGLLAPADDEAAEFLQKQKLGEAFSAEINKPRNYRFLKKYMVLLKLAFDSWEPALGEHKGLPIQKNFTRFRKDVAIATGFYELTVNINGETRAEARSISFAHMDETDFDQLYQKTISLFINKYQMLANYRDPAEVDRVVSELLRFA